MLSKSLGAARTVVRDLFRSADNRRNRGDCWTDSADEWGFNAARAEVSRKLSTKEASDDTFFTSHSFQSNLTDIPAPSADNAIIKDGPQRYVRDIKSGPAVQETYLVLERVSGCDGPLTQNTAPSERRGNPSRAKYPKHPEEDARGNRLGPRIATPGAGKGLCEPGEGRQNGAAGGWRITASTLFAYRAMKTCEQGKKATRLQPRHQCIHHATTEHDDAATCRKLWNKTPLKTHETVGADAALARASDLTNNYDVSDDEGEGDSPGRISPRTFRLWATGCWSQQNLDNQEDVHLPVDNADMDADSTLPSSPTQPALTNDASTWSSSDSESRGTTSPRPEASKKHVTQDEARTKWNHILQWRQKMPRPQPQPQPQPHPSSPTHHPGQVMTLTNHDILSALSHPSAPPFLSHVPLSSIHSALRTRYQLLADSRHAETRMANLKSEAQARIDDLVAGRGRGRGRADGSVSSRTEEDEEADRPSREEIYRHVEGHLADVADMYHCSQARVRALAEEVDSLMERERALRMRLD